MATIEIANVWKRFHLQTARPRSLKEVLVQQFKRPLVPTEESFWALKGVSLNIERGETFGIIGNNGSGKSTMLKLITGISKPTKGYVGVSGRVSALLELGAGFHPDFSGRENTYLNGAILGLSRKEVDAKFDSIVAFAELQSFIDNPVKTYSSGMYMRLAFSIAIHVDPDILVIDEVLAVGDSAFQQKCFDQIHRFKHQGKTIVFVSHVLPTVQSLCQRVAWIDKGELRALGRTEAVLEFYSEQIAADVEKNKAQMAYLVPDQRVNLRSIRALNGQGQECSILKGGEPARFEFQVESDLSSEELELYAQIIRADGTCCYDQRIPLSDFADGAAAGSVAFEIPELRLYHGSYSLNLSAAAPGSYAWLDEKFFNFSVDSPYRGMGIAPLCASWVRQPSAPPVLAND